MAERAIARLFRILLSCLGFRSRFRPRVPGDNHRADAYPHAQHDQPAKPRRGELGPDPDRMAACAIPRDPPLAHQRHSRGDRHRSRASRAERPAVAARRRFVCAGRRNHHLQRTQSRTLSRLSHLYAGAGEGAGAAAKRARDHRRRRRRQLWPLARAGRELARIHAERTGRPPRFAPRLLCRLAAVSTISGGVAALLGACLSDLPLCAVVVAVGSDGGGLPGHRLAHAAGRRGDRRHEQWLSRRLFRCRRAGGTDLLGIARSRRHGADPGAGAAARAREL